MNLKDFLEPCFDKTRKKILCGLTKDTINEYVPLKKALEEYKFIRFGNKFFLPTISLDIDFERDQEELFQTAKDNNIPYPSLIVYTDRGVHLHWMLKYPISTKNEKSVWVYNQILQNLCQVFKSDNYAKAKKAGRVWRNPMAHDVTFWDEKYSLTDFPKPILKTIKRIKKKSKSAKDGVKNIAWGQVKEGTRHMTMFDFLRKKGYRNYKKQNNIDLYLTNIAFKVNEEMPEPLPADEVSSIILSIVTWLETEYTACASDKQVEFNRELAKKKKEKSVANILNYLSSNPFITIRDVKKTSCRKLSKLFKLSHTAVAKYKKTIGLIFEFLRAYVTQSIKNLSVSIVEALTTIKTAYIPIPTSSPPI